MRVKSTDAQMIKMIFDNSPNGVRCNGGFLNSSRGGISIGYCELKRADPASLNRSPAAVGKNRLGCGIIISPLGYLSSHMFCSC